MSELRYRIEVSDKTFDALTKMQLDYRTILDRVRKEVEALANGMPLKAMVVDVSYIMIGDTTFIRAKKESK